MSKKYLKFYDKWDLLVLTLRVLPAVFILSVVFDSVLYLVKFIESLPVSVF